MGARSAAFAPMALVTVAPGAVVRGERPRAAIPPLTGLRFVAAMGVMLMHYSAVIQYPSPLDAIVSIGGSGVSLFFVLSGFILTYNYGSDFATGSIGWRRFMRLRLARIWPLSTLALIVATPLTLFLIGSHPTDPWLSPPVLAISWLANLALLHDLLPFGSLYVWDGPSWSVSAEFFFYLVFPLFIGVAVRWLHGGRALSVAVVILALATAVVLWFYFVLPIGLAGWLATYWPLFRLYEFVLGCMVGIAFLDADNSLFRRLRGSVRGRDALVFGSMAALLAICYGAPLAREAPYIQIWPTILSLLLISALASGRTLIGCLLSSRYLVLLGEASYSLYILHFLPLTVLTTWFGAVVPGYALWFDSALPVRLGPGPGPVLVAGTMVGTIVASILSYKFVETPARRALRPKS